MSIGLGVYIMKANRMDMNKDIQLHLDRVNGEQVGCGTYHMTAMSQVGFQNFKP